MKTKERGMRIAGKGSNRLLLPALLAALVVATPGYSGAGSCPPGLAKKAVPCVPPGQAKKHRYDKHEGIGRGDRVTDYPYHLIRYPGRYGLDPLRPGERYYVVDGQILRVDQDTYEVLAVIRAVAALLD